MDKEEEKIDVTLDEKEIQEEKNEDINFNFFTIAKYKRSVYTIWCCVKIRQQTHSVIRRLKK